MNSSQFRLGTVTLIALATALASCGGGGGGGGGGGVPAQRSNLAYVLHPTDSTIAIYNEDSSTGAMSHLGVMPVPFGQSGPERMLVHPNGKFVYVPNLGTSNLAVFTVDPSTGWLVPGIALAIGDGPHEMAMDPAGKFLYVTSQGSDQLHVFSVNASTGALTFVQSIATGIRPSACAVDRLTRFLFVTLHGVAGTGLNSAIQAYSIDASTGAVTNNLPALALASYQPNDVVVDPIRNNLYTTSEKFDFVIPMSYDGATGALTPRQARLCGDRPVALAIDKGARFVYSANKGGNNVSCFVITDPATGGLSAGPTNVSAGAGPVALSLDPDGKSLYVLSETSQTVGQFSIDSLTGVVNASESLTTRSTPSGIAFASPPPALRLVPRFVHVAASSSDEAPAYTIAPATGALTELPSPAGTNQRPISAATDSRHRYFYVASQTSHTIDGFSIDPLTGALASIGAPGSTIGVPTHVAIEPSGRFLYATTRDATTANDGWVTTWSIDPTSGAITAQDTHQVADLALWVIVDPTGSFVYVASKTTVAGGAKITVFAINPVDGSLTQSPNAPAAASGVIALGYHPKMRVLYAVLGSANAVVSFSADPATGDLTIIPGAAGNSGLSPSSVTIAPNGKFGYVSYLDPAGTGHVTAFSVNPTNGKLVVPGTQYADGLHPSDLAMDGTGQFLYVANSGSNDVSVFHADPATGALVAKTPAPSGLEPNAVVVTTLRQ
jgi:6-phosphogluconolactonase (cycloisomerase 2 family)